MSKIVVVGSINMDVVSLIARHPRPGETIFGSDVKFIPGGKGSNQAVAASRLTDGVMLVGKLGKDAFGIQTGCFISPRSYQQSFKPVHKRLNDWIHQNTVWKTFMHSCDAVWKLIPDFIEAGFDILTIVPSI